MTVMVYISYRNCKGHMTWVPWVVYKIIHSLDNTCACNYKKVARVHNVTLGSSNMTCTHKPHDTDKTTTRKVHTYINTDIQWHLSCSINCWYYWYWGHRWRNWKIRKYEQFIVHTTHAHLDLLCYFTHACTHTHTQRK